MTRIVVAHILVIGVVRSPVSVAFTRWESRRYQPLTLVRFLGTQRQYDVSIVVNLAVE